MPLEQPDGMAAEGDSWGGGSLSLSAAILRATGMSREGAMDSCIPTPTYLYWDTYIPIYESPPPLFFVQQSKLQFLPTRIINYSLCGLDVAISRI